MRWPRQRWDRFEYAVADHFLPALINDDRSGLDDDDEAKLDAWIEAEGICGYDILTVEADDEGSFRRCEIVDLYANCVTLIRLVPAKPNRRERRERDRYRHRRFEAESMEMGWTDTIGG